MHIEGALLGLIAGWLRGGKIRRLTELTLPGWPLAVTALAIQLAIKAGSNCGWDYVFIAAPYLHIISYAPLFWFVYLNRNNRAMVLIGLGLLLNFIVIASNRGFMPVNLSGLAPHLQEQFSSGAGSPLHAALTDKTVFPFLADQIRLTYVFNRIISIGDILLALGIAFLVQHHMVMNSGTTAVVPKSYLPR